jgi:hypothetical protein
MILTLPRKQEGLMMTPITCRLIFLPPGAANLHARFRLLN